MSTSFSTCSFTLAVNLILLTSYNAQRYSSSISQMTKLPSYLLDITRQLETLMDQIRTDLKVLNKTRDRLRGLKLNPKNKSDTFVFVNKLITLKKHMTRRYDLDIAEDFPNPADIKSNLFSITVLQSTYNLDINDICDGHIREEFTSIDLHQKLMIIYSYYGAHESHIHPIRALREAILSINDKFSDTKLYKDVQTKAKWTEIANLYYLIISALVDSHRSYVIKLYRYILEYLMEESESFRDIFVNANIEFVRPNLKEILHDKGELREFENDFENPSLSLWNPYAKEEHIDLPLEQYQYYSKLCQGLYQKTPARPLVCYYKSETPYHLMSPFKFEQVHWDPPIIVIRDFMSDKEIQALMQESGPDLEKSMIGSQGKSVDSILRISANTWMHYLPPELEAMSHRIVSAVPLENEAEPLQVNNYGIGGLYTPHLDNIYQRENPEMEPDRLATFMIYLTDNPESGATIFPLLNLTFFPSRAAAIFWYNIYSNGASDYRTFHAGCPVLTGDKWVVNKWYSSHGQMFRHPCLKKEKILSRKDMRMFYPHYILSE